MSTNQSSQATDVHRLYRRMEELASRLDGMENPPTGRDTASSPRRGGGGRRGMTAGLGMTIEDDDRARRRDRPRANKNDNKKQGRKTNAARNRDDRDERYYAVSRVARELGVELDRIDDCCPLDGSCVGRWGLRRI
ncbi:hypothetical protein ACHAXA_009501 [Cyclostephanos tholiformis]|uniref:Uncharacterized protein n=1 Tax=Cyclostephanos tholiformis TaxID=382380 RepID=A0ABD3RF81_9STRA